MTVGNAITRRQELRSMEATLLARLLDKLDEQGGRQTSALESLRSNIINNVLASGLYLLDSSGQAGDSYQTPFGSLAISNHGTTDMVVTAMPRASSAPSNGKGVARIPAGTFLVTNLAATEWTLYGAAGDAATVQAFTKPQPPSSGPARALLGLAGAAADGVAPATLAELVLGAMNAAGTVDRLREWPATGGTAALAAAQPSSSSPASVNATNAAASIVLPAAGSGTRNRLTAVYWSYSAAAAAGRLTVADGATVIVDQDLITAAAANGQLALPPGGIQGAPNTSMTITLAAGGVGNVGKISVASLAA